jgi:hypothetical protein
MESFAREVRLVFENAILYNGENSEVGGLAQMLLSEFEKSYQTVMQGKFTVSVWNQFVFLDLSYFFGY